MPKKPTDPKIARRFAELVGLGCSQAEAARAVEIGERTGERLLTKPEYRTIMEKARKERAGLAGDVRGVVDAMLTATDSNGQRTWLSAQEGPSFGSGSQPRGKTRRTTTSPTRCPTVSLCSLRRAGPRMSRPAASPCGSVPTPPQGSRRGGEGHRRAGRASQRVRPCLHRGGVAGPTLPSR